MAQDNEECDKDIDWSNDDEIYGKIEKEYWEIVDNQIGEEKRVEYAADLNANVYGSGFGNKKQKQLSEQQSAYTDHAWNFCNFQYQPNSLFQFSGLKDMSGINVPWVYVGMKYSTFCWHFEDLMLPSINYSHYGKPKLWYGVPENNREKFDRVVK